MGCDQCTVEKAKREAIYTLLLEALQGLRYAQACMPTEYYKQAMERRMNTITEALRGGEHVTE